MRRRIGSLLACFAFIAAGVVTFVAPSPSLVRQAGNGLAVVFGVLCLLGALLGLASIWTGHRLFGLIGAALGASASTAFIGSLIIQAVETRSAAPLTAASLVLALVGLVIQRWMDALNRKE